MVKLTVYVHTLEPGTVGYVDKEGAMHACAQAQSKAFEGLSRLSGLFGNRYLCDEDRNAILRIESFCKNEGLEYEIVDLGKMSFMERLSLRLAGMKTLPFAAEVQSFSAFLMKRASKSL